MMSPIRHGSRIMRPTDHTSCRPLRALVLAIGLFATTASQGHGGQFQYYGFDNLLCRGQAVTSGDDPKFFSRHVLSYIDSHDPASGCHIMAHPPSP